MAVHVGVPGEAVPLLPVAAQAELRAALAPLLQVQVQVQLQVRVQLQVQVVFRG